MEPRKTSLQGRNRDTSVENKGGRVVGGCSGGMNWETGSDMYSLICIKWITKKNLLYKKNK